MSRIQLLDPNQKGREAEALETRLSQLVIGQDDAITKIVEAYQGFQTGLAAAGRPIGNFLFLGPTGSGKTRVVEATAEALLKNPGAVVKIDCGEYQHSHEIAKLIGSPPGYLGHRETHALLSQEALNRYHTEELKLSLVLFDEIEKASDALWNLLLGILDKGTLTLGDNRRVDFSQCMIFMTSNLGAAEMSELTAPRLGFHAASSSDDSSKLISKITLAGVAAARRRFSPEFMNRLDHVVVFRSLGAVELRKIVDIELDIVQQRIRAVASENRFSITVTESAKKLLLSEGTDVRYGARPLKRAIERLLVRPLSNLVASRQIRPGDSIRVSHPPDAPSLAFSCDTESVRAWRAGREAA
ncbi:MAG TPA: AAA family ATPase [Candidatus Acidoferrales bacterium]|nr:AAA family ATPase [Candidatus Acidoferrales bacterium]